MHTRSFVDMQDLLHPRLGALLQVRSPSPLPPHLTSFTPVLDLVTQEYLGDGGYGGG
jgi:acetone carboxylase gamma subunit